MNKSDILCLCNFVLKQDVIDSKITDFNKLQEVFNIGTNCGRCIKETKELIKKI